MAEIRFSPAALTDLKEIKAYIEKELLNEQTAADTISEIVKHIRQLAEFPESGAPLSSVIRLETNYRYLSCGSYTVFYRYKNGVVFIDRVLYGRRDFMRVLFG